MFEKRYSDYCNAFNSFSEVLEKNSAFIPKENYELFDNLRRKAYELSCMYPEIRLQDDELFKEENAKLARENYEKTREFNKAVDEAKVKIRNYLSTLKVEKE